MPEQLLDRSDVVPGLEQMRREAVPEQMARGSTLPTLEFEMRTEIACRTLRSIRSSQKQFISQQGVDMNAHEIVAIATRFLVDTPQAESPWIDVNEAARRARCGVKLLYREIRAGRLQAARVGGRRELRLRRMDRRVADCTDDSPVTTVQGDHHHSRHDLFENDCSVKTL